MGADSGCQRADRHQAAVERVDAHHASAQMIRHDDLEHGIGRRHIKYLERADVHQRQDRQGKGGRPRKNIHGDAEGDQTREHQDTLAPDPITQPSQ